MVEYSRFKRFFVLSFAAGIVACCAIGDMGETYPLRLTKGFEDGAEHLNSILLAEGRSRNCDPVDLLAKLCP